MEVPVGLATTTLILVLVAIANLFSKQIATIYGVGFTIFVFVIFTISEQINKRRSHRGQGRTRRIQPGHAGGSHRRNGPRAARLRAGGGPRLQPHGAPARGAGEDQPAAPRYRGDDGAAGLRPAPASTSSPTSSSSPTTKRNCSRAWSPWRKRQGKTVDLIVVPGVDPFDAMVQTAAKLQGVAAGHRRFGDDGFRGTGAAHRDGVGEAARTAPSVLARNHHARTARRST